MSEEEHPETWKHLYREKLQEIVRLEKKIQRMQILIDAAEKMADTLAYAPALGRLWINKKEWDEFEEISKGYHAWVREQK